MPHSQCYTSVIHDSYSLVYSVKAAFSQSAKFKITCTVKPDYFWLLQGTASAISEEIFTWQNYVTKTSCGRPQKTFCGRPHMALDVMSRNVPYQRPKYVLFQRP